MRVLTDASKTLKKFESWVIIILATIDSIFRVLVLPSQNEKKKKEAMFSTVTTKAEKK